MTRISVATTWEEQKARQEANRLLRCIRSLDQRGRADAGLKERELELLRWRLAAVARRTATGAAAVS